MVGRTISHYKILAKLGEGGMGVVYKAEDIKLKRVVALKFLSSHLLANKQEKARFMREAQAAAALDHPNICTVYEVDEVDGETFIAMAYIEGDTVQLKIAEGELSLEEALDIAIQAARGLQAAHESGVVHRDIKPGNIIVTEKRRVSILDFGLAQRTGESRLTKTGMMLGTVAFMSPEQALGRPLDHRTDIWSLGVVLYEMVTGQLPFGGEYELARMYSITNDDPVALTTLKPSAPAELQGVIDRALAKEKDSRYATVAEMIADLRSILGRSGESGFDAPAPATRSSSDATVKLPVRARRRTPPGRGAEQTSLAVLPFRSLSSDPDNAYMADGIAAEVVSALSGVPGVRVAPLLATFRFKNQPTDLHAVAEALQVRYVLTGSLQRAGDRIRVVAELADAVDEKLVWSRTYDRGLDNLFLVQEDIAGAIVGATGGQLIRATAERASIASPESLDAWGLVRKAYHFMNQAYNEEGTVDASNLLRQAIELAPDYAPAHAFLGFYLIQCIIMQASPDPAGDREKALAAVERATQLAPGDPEVLENAGIVWNDAGLHEKSVPTLRRAVEIAPFNLVAWGYLSVALVWRGNPGDQEEALRILDRLLSDTRDHPSYPYWLYFRSLADSGLQRFEDAVEAAAGSIQAQPLFFLSRLSYANALGVLGRLDEARAELEWIQKNHEHVRIDVYVDELYVHARSREQVEEHIKGLRAAGAIEGGN